VKAKNYKQDGKTKETKEKKVKAKTYKQDADKENGKKCRTSTRRTEDIGTITGEVRTKYGVGLTQAMKTEKKIRTAQKTEEDIIR
jgi:hypothetical protein